jgi:SAM-dependent methyltransferase
MRRAETQTPESNSGSSPAKSNMRSNNNPHRNIQYSYAPEVSGTSSSLWSGIGEGMGLDNTRARILFMGEDATRNAMREEWNDRAREDANYFVAFGRRDQTQEEFFASAADQIRFFETELKRRSPDFWKRAVAIEIGCGPGRLLRPLSRHFRQIHGIDVSDEMIALAAHNLEGVENARIHLSDGSSLSQFASESVDFIYSFAVFQHIPSHEIVMNYLEEAIRVLAPGGLFVFQVNGLRDIRGGGSTWNGVRIVSEEILDFAARTNMLLLQLNDRDTQYMWVTLQKREQPHPDDNIQQEIVVRRIVSAHGREPIIPASGPFAAASIEFKELPFAADLRTLAATIDGVETPGCYISPVVNGFGFFNVILPKGTRTGLVPVRLLLNRQQASAVAWVRITVPGPRVPRIEGVSDGTNLLSRGCIQTDNGKIIMEDVPDFNTEDLRVSLAGEIVRCTYFCVNPLRGRFEVDFEVPAKLPSGTTPLEISLGGRVFPPIPLQLSRC